MTFDPARIDLYTPAELRSLAMEGHHISAEVLVKAEAREATQAAQDEAQAELDTLTTQAQEDTEEAREAARPGIVPLVAALEDAKVDRAAKARAFNEAKAAHAVAYSAANRAFQQLHDYVVQHFGDDDAKAGTTWQTVVIDGESYTR